MIALPQVLQPAVMQAGDRGLTTLFTIYNVDTSPVWWEIQPSDPQDPNLVDPLGCTTTLTDGSVQREQYTFSACSSGVESLPIGQSVSIQLTYNAPTGVGEFPGIHKIRGGPIGSDPSSASEWSFQSVITVSSNNLVPSTSTWCVFAHFQLTS